MLPGMVLSRMSWMLLSCLMLLSQVQGEHTQKEAASPRISCPTGSQAYGSYCYALFKIPKSWFDADGQEPNGGGWEWSNADVMNYFNWERNPSIASDPGYCGTVSYASGFLKWRDYYCNKELPYVCKFKG
ncbi:regenerating islet-derived protein 3-beta-like isoform X2 [Nannospalax galili]|uniref:regenerating islet-derived protein 3-beta-like isoform X2 n=1 Tax=Nannospalax galili TaxID=1026970 RepID=UPI0004ED33E7|nr:regenerating islet-derived protein 3-beta-like isoform X2 [Nannospalax galili]